MPNPFDEAVSAIKNANIRHEEIEFPITYKSSGEFISFNFVPFRFHQYGVSYLSYHTNGDAGEYLNMYHDEEWERLAAKINEDWFRVPKDKKLIFAIYNGQLVGVMASYIPVSNSEIMKQIEDLGLSKHVAFHTLTPTLFRVFLTPEVGEKKLATLMIKNGHSGHVAFTYAANFMTGSYEYEIPLIDHARHLGKINNVLHNLGDILEAVKEMTITEELKSRTVLWATFTLENARRMEVPMFSEREQMVLNEIAAKGPTNLLEWIVIAGGIGQKRGYKGAVKTLLDIILQTAFPK